jgi:hypothetical protein
MLARTESTQRVDDGWELGAGPDSLVARLAGVQALARRPNEPMTRPTREALPPLPLLLPVRFTM